MSSLRIRNPLFIRRARFSVFNFMGVKGGESPPP